MIGDVNNSPTINQNGRTNGLGYFQDTLLEHRYVEETWDAERRQLARFMLLVGTLQLLFSFAVVTEFGWDWRFFAGLGLRFFAAVVWLYPLWLTRQKQTSAYFNLALYSACMTQLLVLLWDGAHICIGELDYTSNVLLETLVTALLFYRSPRHLAFVLTGNLIAFLIIYRGIHSNLEYMRTAEFCAVLSVLAWLSAVYRIAQERRLFITNRLLQQQEKLNLVAAERQRLAQEMHDGLGGQLIAALNSLQSGQLTSHGVELILRACIDDMRLVVDAISPTDNDLLSALGNLRYRMEPRLHQLGISLYWKIGALPDSIFLSPDRVLHVLRIAQEALTNILKHAQAHTVVVSLSVRDQAFYLEISDDGIGCALHTHAEKSHGQHGWLTMHNRAISLDGEFTCSPNPTRGITIRLVFPLHKSAASSL
ncbi:MAG: ATP-binding protein [Gallionella sp.]